MMQASGLRTSAGLAGALGVSPQAISNYRKRGAVPAYLIMKFSEKFEVSLDWLVRGKGFPAGGARPVPRLEVQEYLSGCLPLSPEELVYVGMMLVVFRRGNRLSAGAVKSAVEETYSRL